MKKKRPLTEKQKKDIIKWLDDAVATYDKLKQLRKRSEALKLSFCEGIPHIQLSDYDGVSGFERVCEALGIDKSQLTVHELVNIHCIEESFKYKGYDVIHLIRLEGED